MAGLDRHGIMERQENVQPPELNHADESTALLDNASSPVSTKDATAFDIRPCLQIYGVVFLVGFAQSWLVMQQYKLVQATIMLQALSGIPEHDGTLPVFGQNSSKGAPRQALLYGMVLLSSLPQLVSVPALCIYSDMVGRRKPLLIATVGALASRFVFLGVSVFAAHLPAEVLLFGSAIEGITGSVPAIELVAVAHVSDYTTTKTRTAAISGLYGWLAVGSYIGIVLQDTFQKLSTTTFIGVAAIANALCVLNLLFLVPKVSPRPWTEDSDGNDGHNGSSRAGRRSYTRLRFSDLNRAIRRNVICLFVVQCVVFSSGIGTSGLMVFLAMKLDFATGWLQRIMTAQESSYIAAALVILPLSAHFGQKIPGMTSNFLFDLILIRITLSLMVLAYIGYALYLSKTLLLISSIILGFGSVAAPILKSAITKCVDSSQVGTLLAYLSVARFFAKLFGDVLFAPLLNGPILTTFLLILIACLAATWLIDASDEAQCSQEPTN